MKNIKNTLKGIKADFVAFTKDKEKVKGVITTATLLGLGAVAMNEHNKRTFKKKRSQLLDEGYGAGLASGTVGALEELTSSKVIELEQAQEAFKKVDSTIEESFTDNETILNGYHSAVNFVREEY